ncbi:MAG: HD-GYP domain-containing protein, partial [Planctomycetes bacterium]|nr:HD-GYP domain-containing protein [Planctomycetota bacterium]
EFKSGEAMLASAVARRSGTAIRNAKLYQELNELFLSTIKTLVRIIEGKDAYTRGHSERVSAFSMLLAELLDLPLADKEALSWSSLLHDIGKIKIPEEILKKPGRLTDEEFAIIQQHPVFGAEMLVPIGQLSHCLPDIRHHHERIDGKGYPDGLTGDAMPLRAKIIAVADTFDALTSDRCYRPRFGIDKALQIVEEVAGTQLYSEAAATLVANKDAFLERVQTAETPQPANAE